VDQFISGNNEMLQALVDGLPPTKWTVGECVMVLNRSVLLLGDVYWRRLVAIASYLTKVSVRCMKNELGVAIVPLTDQAASQLNE
jgi:hypothetical protein